MRSCLVLGTGRSGTSLVTGLLAGAGYDVGGQAWRARAANPHGFFETPEINGLNETLLAPVLPALPELTDGQRWLGVPERAVPTSIANEIGERIASAVQRDSFALKDPRFSFTLPAWRPFLGDTAFIAVFRHPAATAASMLEELGRADYLQGLELDLEHFFELWIATYRAILNEHSTQGDWLFLHYDQALSEEGHQRLGTFLATRISGDFADPKLRRSNPQIEVPAEALRLYEELCARADYSAEASAPPESLPGVSVVAVVEEGEQALLADLAVDIRNQRGVRTELVLVDATRDGIQPPVDGTTLVRAESASRGAAWQLGFEVARYDLIALQRPGCRPMPSRIAHGLARLEEGPFDLVTCDYWLEDEGGQFIGRSNPAVMGESPGPFWESGVLARRSALRDMRRTAFFPVELELLTRARREGRVGHVEEPGFGVLRKSYADSFERSVEDGGLVARAERNEPEPAPLLSVSLCTFNRPEVFLQSLAAFCRQSVAPGTFELIVVDDGDPQGTEAALAELELPVPTVYLRGPGQGLAAARNAGLARSRGKYVLFVNDDTIPFPDLIEQHLRAHARLGRPACVQGTFEQPQEALSNALLRYLEDSGEVFGYSDMRPGEWHDAFHFYTCNVSVPRSEVLAVGGFDPSFRFYGCEDTDLGARLAQRECRVFYDDRARAHHLHAMDFDYIAKRQVTVARAYVHFFRKHPDLLSAWGSDKLSAEWMREKVAEEREAHVLNEAAARELAPIDVGALEKLGGEYQETAEAVLTAVGAWMPKINQFWWNEGFLAGFEEHGLTGFDELTRRGTDPWPLSTEAEHCLLALPRWESQEALESLLRDVAPLAGKANCALVLRFDPLLGVPREDALARISLAYERCFPNGEALEVVLEEAPLDRSDLHRLGASVDALLLSGDEDSDLTDLFVAERLSGSDEVQRWLARFEGEPQSEQIASEADFSPQIELSVIVPTHNRPRELAQLLDRLALQDLEPERFEVIVVDDGSSPPAAAQLEGLSHEHPYALRVLAQSSRGPAAARNLALLQARGEFVVFLNDDAVPARTNLSAHLRAQRSVSTPVAVLGTFRLLRSHLNTSFARYVETSTALFAQPAMQPGVLYDGLSFCSGNISLPRATLASVGGFDEAFPWAGGEDSELGLRLERELGIKVRFDPGVQCEHDHQLDVRGFEERRRVVGWAAWRIFALHGESCVLGVDARPSDPDWWLDIARRAEHDGPHVANLLTELTSLAERERSTGVGAENLDAIRPALEGLGEHAFYCGLLAAKEGRLPSEARASAPALGHAHPPAPFASSTRTAAAAFEADGVSQ